MTHDSPLDGLPAYWRERFRKLRSENHELRRRLKHEGIPDSASFDELPQSWQRTIKQLRRDVARYRTEGK